MAIIKHANPCGIAVGADVAEAHRKAHACDPVSAFGGVIAANRPVSRRDGAQQVADVFTEVVVAPGYEDGAVEVLAAKKNIRLLVCAPAGRGGVETAADLAAACCVQATPSTPTSTPAATTRPPGRWPRARPLTEAELADLAFAWRACRAVKSNAILLARDGASVGVGMGQVNRVDSCRLAVERAGERAARLRRRLRRVLPVRRRPAGPARRRGPRDRAARWVDARRAEVVEAAQAAGVTMYLTGTRHFVH